MKSQVIFNYCSTWFGRWGNEEGEEIIISADFSDPRVWPFVLKRYELSEDEDTCQEVRTEVLSKRLPKDAYLRVKKAIDDNAESLKACPDDIENAVSDGSDDMFVFTTDTFSKKICGASILSVGSYEAEEDQKTSNYDVYKAFNDIIEALKASGIDIYEQYESNDD